MDKLVPGIIKMGRLKHMPYHQIIYTHAHARTHTHTHTYTHNTDGWPQTRGAIPPDIRGAVPWDYRGLWCALQCECVCVSGRYSSVQQAEVCTKYSAKSNIHTYIHTCVCGCVCVCVCVCVLICILYLYI